MNFSVKLTTACFHFHTFRTPCFLVYEHESMQWSVWPKNPHFCIFLIFFFAVICTKKWQKLVVFEKISEHWYMIFEFWDRFFLHITAKTLKNSVFWKNCHIGAENSSKNPKLGFSWNFEILTKCNIFAVEISFYMIFLT